MIPFVDVHCHLYAGLDDGPATHEEALEMCRIAWQEGTRAVAATAHQNESWPEITPDRIRRAAELLRQKLREIELPLSIYPCAEVMVRPDLIDLWEQGELLSIADRGRYILVELPPGLYLDLREMVRRLTQARVRPILAHPERHPELLHERGNIEQLIGLGCLVQVSSGSLTDPHRREDLPALKAWLRRGIVHLIGSDGHSPSRRPPHLAEAYRCISAWAGSSVADRICSSNGLAVLEGLPLRAPRPAPPKRRWFARPW